MRLFTSARLLGFSLSLATLAGCGSSEDNKIVEKAPPVTADEVSSTPPPNIDNPSTPPIAPAEGAMRAEKPTPATGDAPAVVDEPAAPTGTPKPE